MYITVHMYVCVGMCIFDMYIYKIICKRHNISHTFICDILCICIHMHIHVYGMCIYIYICMCIHIYIYMYIHA